MMDLEKKLLDQFNLVLDDLMASLNLSERSEKEIKEIRSFLQEALGDRVNLFILENLSSEGLAIYEKMISEKEVDFKKIGDFVVSDIKDFKNLLQKDLTDFAKEALSNFNK
ncbi:MAG: hypothetical protein PHP37_02815 [Patescibacteria group bacterium]|nr:hypothetical protein [Patescibacteria group bacterium]